jgi:hypothetical protein
MKNNVSRRDFLKLGSLAALSLPAINKVGSSGPSELLESPDLYGGFLIKTLAKGDSPYEVDDSIYQRFDARDVIFSRIIWDTEYVELVSQTEKVFTADDPGYQHIDSALKRAAGFCGLYNGTASPTIGKHRGLLSLSQSIGGLDQGPKWEGQWDHSGYSPEDVAGIMKKAALFLGASLVGIAPMDERWLYAKYYDMFESDGAPIEITEVEIPELPEGQVSSSQAGELILAEFEKMEGEEVKEFMLQVMENAPNTGGIGRQLE